MTTSQRLSYSLLANALDYLESAIDLATQDAPKTWKYSILHLMAGIELLLKKRLEVQDWSLIFANPSKARIELLNSGNFKSVDVEGAIDRLQGIGVIIDGNTISWLTNLKNYRNRLQHFALDVQKTEIVPLVAYGLHFCLDFIDEHLKDWLEAEHRKHVKDIKRRARDCDIFVQTRMEAIRCALRRAKYVLDCPYCGNLTMELGNCDPRCLLCHYQVPADELAESLEVYWYDGIRLHECYACRSEYGFVDEQERWVCLECGAHGELQICGDCGELYSGPLRSAGRCPQCWAHF